MAIGLGSSDPDLKQYKGVIYGTFALGFNRCGNFSDGCDSGAWAKGFGTVAGWDDFLTTNELKLGFTVTPAVKFKWGISSPGFWTKFWNKVPVIGSSAANFFNLDLYVGLQDAVTIGLNVVPEEGSPLGSDSTLTVNSALQFITGTGHTQHRRDSA